MYELYLKYYIKIEGYHENPKLGGTCNSDNIIHKQQWSDNPMFAGLQFLYDSLQLWSMPDRAELLCIIMRDLC